MHCKMPLLILSLTLSLILQAQTHGPTHYVRGTIHDSISRTTLEEATVACWQSGADQPYQIVRSGKNGFGFRLAQAGSYYFIATYLGYLPDTLSIVIHDKDTSVIAVHFLMQWSSKPLMEVIVRANIPPVLVKADTIGFNAGAFPTRPYASVED